MIPRLPDHSRMELVLNCLPAALLLFAICVPIFHRLDQPTLASAAETQVTSSLTPDQLRIVIPSDGRLYLLAVMRTPKNELRFSTVSLTTSGMTADTILAGSAYTSSLKLDLSSIMYRGAVPAAPGPCTWEGTGAFAVDGQAQAFYVCMPEGKTAKSSWVRFSGGSRSW